MKFDDLLIFNEANLFNKDKLINDIKGYLDTGDELSAYPGYKEKMQIIENWFLTQYVRWFCSPEDDQSKLLVKHRYLVGEPEWAKKEDILDFIGFNSDATDEFNHIIDYFFQLSDIDLNKIFKETYPVIRQKVKEWDEHMKKQMTKKQAAIGEGTDFKTIEEFDNGYRWVELLSQKAYTEEGNKMGHCVGGYFNRGGTTKIWSLRDSKMEPHCTMELRLDNKQVSVYQIKGKQNQSPKKEYWPLIKHVVEKYDLKVVHDGENLGMANWSSGWYFKDSKQWRAIYEREIIPKQQEVFKSILSNIKNGVHRGNISLASLYLQNLPDLRAIKIIGNFDCSNNDLTSLVGAPQEVFKSFDCSNNSLTSLVGGPEVCTILDCSKNNLTSLVGCPITVTEFITFENPGNFNFNDKIKAIAIAKKTKKTVKK